LVKKKLFTPFFTTKQIGKGTGLGLYIIKQIIDAHKGEIFIDNAETHRGAKVILKLPQA